MKGKSVAEQFVYALDRTIAAARQLELAKRQLERDARKAAKKPEALEKRGTR